MTKSMELAFPVDENRFRTLPGRAVLRKTVNRVRSQGADIIVLLRHAGKYGSGENTFELIKNIPEIDLVIGAHAHKPDAGSTVGRAWFVQPPPHGRALSEVRISFDRKERKIKQITSRMIELETVAEYAGGTDAVVPGFYGRTPDYPAELIGRKTGADLVLYCISDQQKLQELLQISSLQIKELYRVFPYFDPIITVGVSAEEFKAIYREYLQFAGKRRQYIAKSGFSAEVSRSKLRSVSMHKTKKIYTLAVSAYVAAGAGGNLPETRRILSGRINYQEAENAPGVLDVLLKSLP